MAKSVQNKNASTYARTLEKELEKKNSLLQATLDSTTEGLLVVDRKGKIAYFNQRFVQMWEIPERIIATRDDTKALEFAIQQLKDPKAFLKKVNELYNKPAVESFDVIEFKDGRIFERYSRPQRIGNNILGRVWNFLDVTESKKAEEDIKAHVRILDNVNKELSDTQQAMSDLITEQRQMAKQLGAANKKLKELDARKDEFISLAAHELKTPLTSIKGFAQLLQNEIISNNKENRNHYLDLINKNTDKLYGLILDIIDTSRISLGKVTINVSEIDLYALFNDIKENMEIVIKEKEIVPTFTIGENLPKIKADYARVLQVLRNLIINSVHYTEKTGTITTSIYREKNNIQFEVKDTGQGIPAKNQKYIFSRFYQVDPSMTRKVGGSGLGLSVCKGLIELMKGKIWFESKEGKGTTFYFTLPLQK